MVSYKKAISPVVATALLLVVAVVAVVGFQSWFATYQSGINVQVEQESAQGSAISIERLGSGTNPDVYVKYNGEGTVNVTVSVPSVSDCVSAETEISKGVQNLSLSGSCDLTQDNSYNVVAVSDSGVYEETEIAR